jgi:hypothetical protein
MGPIKLTEPIMDQDIDQMVEEFRKELLDHLRQVSGVSPEPVGLEWNLPLET